MGIQAGDKDVFLRSIAGRWYVEHPRDEGLSGGADGGVGSRTGEERTEAAWGSGRKAHMTLFDDRIALPG